MLNKEKHRVLLFKILKDIFNSDIWPFLAFKWWTACYFLYWLERFSTDLDFDLIDTTKNIDENSSIYAVVSIDGEPVKEIELSIFSKDELKDFDEPKMTYGEWLEEYKRRQKEEEQNNRPLFQESLNEVELDIFKKDK